MFSQSPSAKVFLQEIKLHNYRNYSSLQLKAGEGHIILWGENGAGKTNLLESLSLLSPGRGLKRAQYKDLIKNGEEERGFSAYIKLFSSLAEDVTIGTGFVLGDPVRRVKINGASCSSQTLLDYCQVTWLVPSMDGLFTGASGDRRKFLDRFVLAIDHNHGQRVSRYEKVLRARNRLLQDGVNDSVYFLALERQIAQLGISIAAARLEFINLISSILEDLARYSPFPLAKISLIGDLESALKNNSALDVEEKYREELSNNRAIDRAAGRTISGVHKSDFLVFYAEKSMQAAQCSTGEQKALLISLILAHARLTQAVTGAAPIVLLDEVAAHLDEYHRKALFSLLDEMQVQGVMTGTDRFLFKNLNERAWFYQIKAGGIINSA